VGGRCSGKDERVVAWLELQLLQLLALGKRRGSKDAEEWQA
jgi:hypothetical protein